MRGIGMIGREKIPDWERKEESWYENQAKMGKSTLLRVLLWGKALTERKLMGLVDLIAVE